jgi:hypothetical protein
MNWQPGECRPGDMIRVRLGSIYHYGVFVSEEEVIAFGMPPIAAYRDHPDRLRVCATDIDVFACGSIVEIAVPENRAERKKRLPPGKSVALARGRLGEEGYNLLHNNCEHFANECVFGERRCELEEWAYNRWRSRPICNVYLTLLPEDAASGEGARLAARKLIALAARHCFGLEEKDLHLEAPRTGEWSCDRFRLSLAQDGRWLAAAVSNKDVAVEIGGTGAPDCPPAAQNADVFSCRLPEAEGLLLSLRAEQAASAHFYLTDGANAKVLCPAAVGQG